VVRGVRRRKATRKESLISEKKAPGKLARAKGTRNSAKSTTAVAETFEGFSDEERTGKGDNVDCYWKLRRHKGGGAG
jgi:hypothetical protein